MDIRKVIIIDQYIKTKSTGSPDDLSKKIGITKRSVYKYIRFMKEELNAPISFAKTRGSYVYLEFGEFNLTWKSINFNS